jgi:aryl-alcohol dehydrogenase-like predicted oxidoreductase
MRHVPFGRTGLRVSELCLGTMTFGVQCDEAASHAILDAAYEAGIDFLDTADVYPLGGGPDRVGRTEEIVGSWLKGRRDDVIVATKCFGAMGAKPWQGGMSRKHVLDAIDGSLRRLGTDHVDLYQLHGDDPATPIDEVLEALDTIVRSGRARYVGVSNWLAYRLARAIGRSEARGLVRFESVQPRYNLLFRQIERELLPLCLEDGVAVIPYNPIAGGLLSGKHQGAAADPDPATRFADPGAGGVYRQRYWHEREFATIEALKPLAADAGLSLVTLAVAWVASNPAVTSPIIGATRPEQLVDSIAATEATLDADLLAELDRLTHEYRFGDSPR